MKYVITVILTFSLCLLSACGGSRTAVILAGSTSVQPYAEVLAEWYESIYPDRAVDIQGGGSSAGIRAAVSGTADIGMSSRSLSEEELEMWNIEIAKDGLVLIVHPGNPIADLTLEQARGIYTGEITDWGELGGAEHRIHVITREEGSGTRGAFEDMVMDGGRITQKAIVQDSNGSVRQLVSNDMNSIGFISLGLSDESVKSLSLDGVEATWHNVHDGSYSLYRPFLFVSEGEPDGLTKQFIDFTMSAEGQRLLMVEGLVTIMGEVQ